MSESDSSKSAGGSRRPDRQRVIQSTTLANMKVRTEQIRSSVARSSSNNNNNSFKGSPSSLSTTATATATASTSAENVKVDEAEESFGSKTDGEAESSGYKPEYRNQRSVPVQQIVTRIIRQTSAAVNRFPGVKLNRKNLQYDLDASELNLQAAISAEDSKGPEDRQDEAVVAKEDAGLPENEDGRGAEAGDDVRNEEEEEVDVGIEEAVPSVEVEEIVQTQQAEEVVARIENLRERTRNRRARLGDEDDDADINESALSLVIRRQEEEEEEASGQISQEEMQERQMGHNIDIDKAIVRDYLVARGAQEQEIRDAERLIEENPSRSVEVFEEIQKRYKEVDESSQVQELSQHIISTVDVKHINSPKNFVLNAVKKKERWYVNQPIKEDKKHTDAILEELRTHDVNGSSREQRIVFQRAQSYTEAGSEN